MRTIIIVDDELWIRRGLEKRLASMRDRVRLIGQAADGLCALEMIRALKPDVVITDVKMPKADGLEVIREARKTLPDTKFVILSGYPEFEFARRAIEYGVSEYILKPIKDDDILRSINKIINELDRSGPQAAMTHSLSPSLNEAIFGDPQPEAPPGAVRLGPEESDAWLCVSVVHAFAASGDELARHVREPLSRCADKYRWDLHLSICPDNRRECFVVLSGREKCDLNQITHAMQSLQRRLLDDVRILAVIGIGGVVSCISQTRRSFREARCAVFSRFAREGDVLVFDGYRLSAATELASSPEPLAALEHRILQRNIGEARALIFSLLSRASMGFMEPDAIGPLVAAIFTKLFDICYVNNLSLQSYLRDGKGSSEVLDESADNKELAERIYSIVSALIEDLDRNGTNLAGIVNAVQKKVAFDYKEDLSLTALATEFGISVSYLSSQFKAATGMNFVDYLSDVRISRAKELLDRSGMVVSSVAHSVGFDDERYFYRVFHRIVGSTPVEYRTRCQRPARTEEAADS